MPEIATFRKPKLKSAMSTPVAILVTPVVLAAIFFVSATESLVVALVFPFTLFVVVPIATVVSRWREPDVPHGRMLRIDRAFLRKFDADNRLVAEIDATQPFKYRVLDLAEQTDPRIRLYQGATELTFYPTDPGGMEAVRRVVQIKWPPRPRVSAGYSG